MKNENNQKRSFKYMLIQLCRYSFQIRQKGSLLIGFIITMVIFSILSLAMFYAFSSSSFDAVFGNSAQRAYYAAEAGARYKIAIYRHTAGMTIDTFATGVEETVLLPSSNGQAKITITPSMIDPTTSKPVTTDQTTKAAESKTLTVGGSLLLVAGTATNNFPLKMGFFQVGTGTVYYRYKYRTGNTLYLISGQGTLPTVTSGSTDIIAPKDQVLITSKGTAGIISRTIELGWILSGGGSWSTPAIQINFDDASYIPLFQGIVGYIPSGNFVQETTPGGGCTNSNFRTETVTEKTSTVAGESGYFNNMAFDWQGGTGGHRVDLEKAWLDSGKLLSYDIQVKIKVDPDASDTPNITAFLAGIGFKGTNRNANAEVNTWGVAILKGYKNINGEASGIPYHLEPPPDYFFPYDKCFYTCFDWCPQGCEDYCDTSSNRCFSYPVIVVWKRVGTGATAGIFSVEAYKVVTNPEAALFTGHQLNDFSTLLVRSIEAYPLTFNASGTTTPFRYNDMVTVKRSGVTDPIATFRINGAPLVASGSFAGGNAVGTLTISTINIPDPSKAIASGDELWVGMGTAKRATATGAIGTRTHYIRVYYGTPGGNGTANDKPDINRAALPRLCNTTDKLKWPVDDPVDWAPGNDYFRLVIGWQHSTTGASGNIVPLASGEKEYNGVLAYTALDGPMTDPALDTLHPPGNAAMMSNGAGVFLFAAGKNANRVHWDDFGIQWETLSGVGYITPNQ